MRFATPNATQEVQAMFIVRRGDTYYFRCRVPGALRSVVGKREIIKTLKTSDKATALSKASVLLKQTKAKFDELLRKSNANLFTQLSDEEISQFCANYVCLRMQEIDEFKRDLLPEFRSSAYEHFAESLVERERSTKKAYALGDFTLFDAVLPRFLLEQNISLARTFSKPNRDDLNLAFLKANVVLINYEKSILEGEVVDPPVFVPLKKTQGGISILDAKALWADNTNRHPKTLKEVIRLCAEFSDFYSEALQSLTRARIQEFFKARQSLSNATLVKEAGLLRAVCAVAVEHGQLNSNPFSGLKIAYGAESMTRDGFSRADLKIIFEHRFIMTNPELQFLATLAMISGARLEELSQLTKNDFLYEGSILYFSINARKGKSIKTRASVRFVPIHKSYHGYVESYIQNRDESIFDFKSDINGRRGSLISKRFNRFVRTDLKLPESKTFHSFRHSFKTFCREAEIPTEIHQKLTGHAHKDVGSDYGDFSIEVLYNAVSKLRFISACDYI